MALTPARVLVPLGRLNPKTLWPSLRTTNAREDRAEQFIDQARARATSDGFPSTAAGDPANLHMVYYLAWVQKYDEQLEGPTSSSIADGDSASWGMEQIRELGARAQEELRQYLALLDELRADSPVELIQPTMALPIQFSP